MENFAGICQFGLFQFETMGSLHEVTCSHELLQGEIQPEDLCTEKVTHKRPFV